MRVAQATKRFLRKRYRAAPYRTNRGMTLVIAIVIVPILLAIAVSFVDPIIRSYRAAAADQKTNLAKAVADSMFEEALWQTRDAGTGETTDAEFKKDYDFGTAYGKWWVFGTPETDTSHLIAGKYTIPSPGSGDAGGDYCSTRDPVVDADMLADAQAALGLEKEDFPLTGETDVFEWPCHWDKIREGESVSIPLYVEDGATGAVLNPVDLGLTSFTLNIRAACDPAVVEQGGRTDQYMAEVCGHGERYGVYAVDEILREEIIVLWEITGTMNEGTAEEDSFYLGPYKQGFFVNSNIISSIINNYYTLPVLTENSPTEDQDSYNDDPIGGYLQNNNQNPDFKTIDKPVLTFMVIHTLRDFSGDQIPYLEYQFSAPAPTGGLPAVTSTSKVVRVDVMVDGGYSETLEKSIALPKATTGFVIQQ